jgi:hypothetical protein
MVACLESLVTMQQAWADTDIRRVAAGPNPDPGVVA